MSPEAALNAIFSLGVTPWMLLLGILLPLLALAYWGAIYPTWRIAWLVALPCALTLPIPWLWAWWWIAVLVVDALVLLVVTLDLLSLPGLKRFRASRSMSRVASLGNWQPAELEIVYLGRRRLRLQLADDAADGLALEPPVHSLQLQPSQRVVLKQRLKPPRRGLFRLECLFVQVFSFGRLWRRQFRVPCPGVLHVYPDIKQIGEYALLARTNRLSLIGVRKTRKAGQENNFERLRDYQADDNYKHIDWRSTARRQKLTVRQFQADQSQRVIFLLDCGRMMTNEYDGKSLVDYALNSILMLSYVALSQGDSVGMISFSDRIHNYVPPTGGKRQMNRLLHAGFDQFPQLVQSRFDQAFLYLSTHCRRRSLVVLVTNVIDQVNADQIQNYLGNLIGSHLPLLVLLRDHSVFQYADHPAPDPAVMFRSAAASQLLVWRHQVLRRMQAQGCLALDVFPEDMTSPLVNKYLEVKAQQLL
jgi:uncharacterized protein (DUF58 family)